MNLIKKFPDQKDIDFVGLQETGSRGHKLATEAGWLTSIPPLDAPIKSIAVLLSEKWKRSLIETRSISDSILLITLALKIQVDCLHYICPSQWKAASRI